MKTKMSLAAASLLMMGLSTISYASEGNGGRGGGDVIHCNGGLPFLFFGDDGTSLTDTELSYSRNVIPNEYLNDFDESLIRESVLSFLDQAQPAVAAELRAALAKITFTEVPSVETIDTGAKVGLLSRIFGCSRKQIAVQDFDVPTKGLSRVRLAVGNNKKEDFKKLGTLPQAFLKIHEAFIYLASSHSLATATDLKAMETEARAKTSAIYNMEGLDAFVIPDVARRANKVEGDMTAALFSWFDYVLSNDGFNYSQEIVTFNVDEMVGAGLDPNKILECKMPILDFAIGHLVASVGNDPHPLDSPAAALALIKHGAKVDAKSILGDNPIHMAAARPDAEVTEALIHAGADFNAPWCPPGSKEGDYALTPLDISKDYSNASASLLKRLGAKSGKDLSVRCSAIPKLTKADKKAANCDVLKNVLADFAKP